MNAHAYHARRRDAERRARRREFLLVLAFGLGAALAVAFAAVQMVGAIHHAALVIAR